MGITEREGPKARFRIFDNTVVPCNALGLEDRQLAALIDGKVVFSDYASAQEHLGKTLSDTIERTGMQLRDALRTTEEEALRRPVYSEVAGDLVI